MKGELPLIKVNELLGIIYKEGLTQSKVARKLNITPKTFYAKMGKGIFGSDEISIMIKELHIDNAMEIFFADEVT